MNTVEMKECPFCGGSDFIESMVASDGGVILTAGVLKSDILYATVCRDCGSVVRLFCKTPEKLYPKKNAESRNPSL